MNLSRQIIQALSSPEAAALQARIARESRVPGFSWTQGGCYAIAETLVQLTGGELWAVAAWEENDYPCEHAVAKVGHKYYDARGERSQAQLLKEYRRGKAKPKLGAVGGWADLWYPEDYFCGQQERARLREIFRKVGL